MVVGREWWTDGEGTARPGTERRGGEADTHRGTDTSEGFAIWTGLWWGVVVQWDTQGTWMGWVVHSWGGMDIFALDHLVEAICRDSTCTGSGGHVYDRDAFLFSLAINEFTFTVHMVSPGLSSFSVAACSCAPSQGCAPGLSRHEFWDRPIGDFASSCEHWWQERRIAAGTHTSAENTSKHGSTTAASFSFSSWHHRHVETASAHAGGHGGWQTLFA